MKLLALTVYDEKAECFGHPFFVSAIGIGTRMMATWVTNPDSIMEKHPNDFTLYQVGTWNDSEAKFENLATPKFICRATDSMLESTATNPQGSLQEA